MTWYFDSSGTTMDVYDHEKTLVAESREFGGLWSGDFPNEVLTVMRESMDGDQPSAYNQALLGDAATENIEQGVPECVSMQQPFHMKHFEIMSYQTNELIRP